ncbi:MAG: DnaJ domain-containing protein [Candidatus Latescibacteria bacterium]|nr:DnaJ domain-containing protein [Candidatus Latescibacterota bacterium]
MLAHYWVLGLSPAASQEEIRQRYLQLIRTHPPSQSPERFQQITAAYEALKDDRSRVESAIFGMAQYGDFELALAALVQARPAERKTPGLKMLLAAEGKTTGNPQMMKGEGKDG